MVSSIDRCYDHPVSIHAPPEGRDQSTILQINFIMVFQSTRPRRGAICVMSFQRDMLNLFQSTRPRRGAIKPSDSTFNPWVCFNPRAPGGARLLYFVSDVPPARFQSTRPRRGAILKLQRQAGLSQKFQSTRPRRGAIQPQIIIITYKHVSIHAPPEGRDLR